MGDRVGMEGSFAVSEAVKMADVDVVAAYPITPQTHIVERLSEMVADGELDAEFICVESEHSAMSACVGASAAGARVFTCTAGQGLELMHEVLYIPSSMRLPVVAVIANRALSGPLNVWGDHSDVMAIRDIGWVQIFAENAQQAMELTLCAYRIAEESLVPTMIHLDGFHLTHVIEPVVLPDQEDVDRFLPPSAHPFVLDPDKPLSMGCYGPPYIYQETKKAQDVAFAATRYVISDTWRAFKDIFGSEYNPIEIYNIEKADAVFVMMGSFVETAMLAVDELKKQGKQIGIIRIRQWRPFPFKELRDVIRRAGYPILFVLDRCISFGMGGPVASEVRSALYNEKERPKVISFLGGLGGREISVKEYKKIVEEGFKLSKHEPKDEYVMIGVRE